MQLYIYGFCMYSQRICKRLVGDVQDCVARHIFPFKEDGRVGSGMRLDYYVGACGFTILSSCELVIVCGFDK